MNLTGVVNFNTMRVKYYKPIPKELEDWYVFTLDGGHNIFVLLKQSKKELKNNPQKSYEDFMVPCPVKTVLKGYTVNNDGIIVVDGLHYSKEKGLVIPEENFEYD
jgi:hypothetical protein